jgi:hypothetical protein
LYKIIAVLYIVCFGLYVLFSRQPDYFDGEKTKGTIHFVRDSARGKPHAVAVYTINKISYSVNAAYPFKNYNEGSTVDIN